MGYLTQISKSDLPDLRLEISRNKTFVLSKFVYG